MQTFGNAVFIPALIALVFLFADFSQAQTSEAPLRLIGTIVSANLGGAVFQDGSGKQFFYQLYDKLPNGSKIVELHDDSIALKGDDGVIYEMFISHDNKTAAASAAPATAATALAPPPPQTTTNPPRFRNRPNTSGPRSFVR